MSDGNKVRLAHELLDEIDARKDLTPEQTEVLRSFLPKRPEPVTLEQVFRHANAAWANARGNEWLREEEDLEAALLALRNDLSRLIDEPKPAVPALPAGMRLADHEQYGRVVTSPKPNRDGVYDLLVPRPKFETGADWEYAHECELTFIDAEPTKPAHPEFLETEADYRDAPEGTIVACEDSPPWHKFDSAWLSTITCGRNDAKSMTGVIRQILRWGWGNE